jgi:PAS domain S-box-containing protein
MWNRKKKEAQEERELARMHKVQDSQRVLLEAATATADAAHDVTTRLKARLDESLRQLESTAKLLSDALIICTAGGRIETFNPAAERIFGWPASEIVGYHINTLFRKIGDSAITTCEDIINVFTSYHPSSTDALMDTPLENLRGKRRSGETFWIDGSVTRLDRMDGSSIAMLLIRDVTAHMELQNDLKLNESRYRSIFEQSFDGIIVVQNYHIVAANPAITRVLGYTSEYFIAKPLQTFFHKQSVKTLYDNHTARMNGDSSPKNYVVTGVKADGTTVELLVSSTLIKWETNNASLITLKDVTEIRKLETDLGHATRINNSFVNNDIDMLACYDKQGCIKQVNQAYLTHFSSTESQIIGTNFFERIPSEDRAGYQVMLQSLDTHRPTGRFQFHFEMANGEVQIQDWIVHAIFDATGQFVEFQSLGRDLTSIIKELRAKP